MTAKNAVRVSSIQAKVDLAESFDDRVERICSTVAKVALDSDFLVLPELWPSGGFDLALGIKHAATLEENLATGWLGTFAQIASENDVWIHAGSFVERDIDATSGRDLYFNTTVVLDRQGKVASTYRKIHLFGFDTGEATLVTAGNTPTVVDTPLGTTGLATCYDLRFPELFRSLVDLGATTILLPSAWPESRIDHWNILTQARAIENQVWLVGVNEVGTQASYGHPVDLGGRSIVVDPAGRVVTHGGSNEEVLHTEVDTSLASEVRLGFPVLRDRK